MIQQEKDTIWSLLVRKLNNEATSEELAELDYYMESHTGIHSQSQELQQLWDMPNPLDTDFLEATYILHKGRMEARGAFVENLVVQEDHAFALPVTKRFNKRSLFIASVLSLIAAFLFIYFFTPSAKKDQPVASTVLPTNEITTRKGSRTQVSLPDGSIVWLNAESKLDYHKEFGGSKREVYLTGEAYFDVVKNPEKPFIVHTRTADIRVLGTIFNVKSYPNDKVTETSLIRGRVEVTLNHRPDEKWILQPNEKLVLQNYNPDKRNTPLSRPLQVQEVATPIIIKKSLTYQPGDTTAKEVAWVNNIISFNDESFEEVCDKLSRWFDVEFEFKNAQLKQLVLHNSFKNESLDQVLESLEYSFNFHHKKDGNKIILY